jgi:predicted PurR-regulated permease PerM
VAVLALYGVISMVVLPIWALAGNRLQSAAERVISVVPDHTAQFLVQVRASERWPDDLGLPPLVRDVLANVTRRASRTVQAEVHGLGVELAGVRRLLPWLGTVPLITFALLTRWSRFRRSTTRLLPTAHLQWRGDQFLRHVNGVLAGYTRAQVTAALIVGTLSWVVFTALRLPYPGTLGLTAGLLEMVPLAGPIAMAIVATATAPGRALPILVFLGGLRLAMDYAIYPRVMSRAMHLHPLAVVVALWIGAATGGLIGVCLAVPLVGVLQVTLRHWREYRDIQQLIRETSRS